MIKTLITIIFTLLPIQKGEDLHIIVSGTIFCQEGGKTNIPLGGASLSLISGKDTLNTVSDKLGKFSFSIPSAFEVIITAKYQGFDDYREVYQLFGDHTAIAIKMNQSREQLNAARIESEIPFVRKEADTTIYNMAALEKMEGDRALDVLLQIPGFGINKGKLTVWGEYVDKTYVNGKLIYGDDPMSALSLLKAEEIKNVRVYDTQYLADRHRGVKNSKKRRVIDILTFKQFLSAVDLQAQTRLGTSYGNEGDTRSNNLFRFSSGFDFDSNREMRQIGAYVNGNNINDQRNGIEVVKDASPILYSDKTFANTHFKYVRKWKDTEWGNRLSVHYEYNLKNEKRSDKTIIDRARTEGGLTPLHYEENRSSMDKRGYHLASIEALLHQSPIKDLSFYMGLYVENGLSSILDKISNTSGTIAGIQYQDQTIGTKERGLVIAPDITWTNLDTKSGWIPSISLSCELSNNLSYSYTIDTLRSSTTRRYLEGNGGDNGRHFSGSFSLKKTLSNTGLLTTELEFFSRAKYMNEHKNMMTVDYLLPENDQIDYTNSFDYSWNNFQFSVGAGFSMSSPSTQLLAIQFGVMSDKQLDKEVFPTEIRASNNYKMPFATLSITPTIRKNRFSFNYSLSGDAPALEQTRGRVDNSNPLRLRIGNPDLKASLKHTVGIGFIPHISAEGSYLSFNSSIRFDQNPIVDRIRFFSQLSPLQAWGVDYEIPAGGTLTGYENADLAYSVYGVASYECRVKPLKGTFSSGISFNYHRSPEYDGDCLNYVMGFGPELNLSFLTMPVKFLRLNFSSGTSYTKDINHSGTIISELILENYSISSELRFLKHAFCNASYSASIYK